MRKMWLVARHEFLSTLGRRSAQVVMFGLPVLTLVVLAGINTLAGSSGSDGNSVLDTIVREAMQPAGLVDETGRLDVAAHQMGPALFALQSSREAASAALDAGAIRGYYVVPADYPATGELFYYATDTPLNNADERVLYALLAAAFVGDEAPAERLQAPVANLREVDLTATGERVDEASGMALGFGLGFLFYLTAITASGYLMQSLGTEKQNRVMEILLSSLRPFDLLFGKLVALGAIGLLQMGIWTALSLFVFDRQGGFLDNLSLPDLPAATWALVVLHFFGGYLLYASLFAALGAIAPNPRESSQYTFFVMLPTFLPLWFMSIFLAAPGGGLATGLSLFPMSAPVAMPLRLASSAVPAWQWLLSLALTVLASFGALWLATRVFDTRTLLSSQSLSLGGVRQALRRG